MSQNVAKNDKTTRHEAARLIAEDELSIKDIAEKLGVSARSINRWKRDSVFAAQVQQIVDEYKDRALKHGLARREKRITVLNLMHEKLLQVIEERSVCPDLEHIPGGKTGIVTKQLKGIGKGDDFQVVEVYEVDTGLLKEIRAIHEQVAEELGQKITKHEHSGPGGRPIEFARAKLIAQLAG